jgi:hypothetical protein
LDHGFSEKTRIFLAKNQQIFLKLVINNIGPRHSHARRHRWAPERQRGQWKGLPLEIQTKVLRPRHFKHFWSQSYYFFISHMYYFIQRQRCSRLERFSL